MWPKIAYAAADSQITAAASSTAGVLKENLVSSLGAALPLIATAGIIVLVVLVIGALAVTFLGWGEWGGKY